MIGSRLGPYRVLGELGSGGMGKVYLAEVGGEAPRLETGRSVALKVIHPHLLETPGFFKRFLREAQIGQDVRHENVVRCFDCDATMLDGATQHFLVMEHVEGQTLRDLLEELERVPEELCRHIGREVGKGLAAIHEAGVIHRDLKPENVLITADHVLKVMDLGVARLQDEAIRLSQAGSFVGSLEYAAPEQFLAADGEPDGRADLHALGVVLYELATGQHPYRDEDAARVLRNVLDEMPRKAGEVNPQLSPFFEEVIHNLLAKDREERFGSATELVGVLEEGEKGAWWTDRALVLRVQTKQPLRRIRIPRETALYGRDDDLARLHALYDKAKVGNGQVLLIEGEAGIGKTRLVDEFVGRLRGEGEDVNFLFGSYPPGGAATAAGAFSTAYREHYGEEGLAEALRRHLTVTPLLVPAFAALLKGDAKPVEAAPLTKDSLQTVFVHATRALASERTTIVLIDDLHFAPEDGRALFSSLATAVPEHRVLLVGTARRGVSESWMADLTRLEHAEPMSLARLGPKDLGRLLIDAFRSERLATELGLQIATKSDGNPFFAFEIIRGLREGQFISQLPDGTWVTTKVIRDIQIPSSVTDLIQARIADLEEHEKNLLDVASCCGFEFDPLLVARVLGLDRIPAMQQLARLEQRHRLVRSAGRRFVFDHHQVQESLYAGIPELLRESYHAAIADALETVSEAAESSPEDLDGAFCVELCDHFLRGAQGERAARYLDASLEHLEAAYLHDRASSLARRGLDVPRLIEGRERVGLLLRMNWSLDRLGRRDPQQEGLGEALRLAEKMDDASLRFRVHIARGAMCSEMSRYENARVEYQAALELGVSSGDEASQATALRGLGGALTNLAHFDEAVASLERALSLCRRSGNLRGEARACNGLAWAWFQLGRMDEEIRMSQRMLEIAEELADRSLESLAEAQLANVCDLQGRYAEARAKRARNVRFHREMGDRAAEAISAGNLAITIDRMGLSAEALERYDRSRQMSREVGRPGGEATKLLNSGALLIRLGAPEEGRVRLEKAIQISREVGRPYYEASMLADRGACAEEEEDPEEAERFYRQSVDLYAKLGVQNDQAAAGHLRYGALLVRLGHDARGRERLEEAVSIATDVTAPAVRVVASLHLALLRRDDSDEVVQLFDDVEERLSHDSRIEARFLLYRLTGDVQHLQAAHDLLAFFVEHAPEAYRETTRTRFRIHREILEAWASLDPGPSEGETGGARVG